MTNRPLNINFFSQIVDLLQSARNNVVRAINQTMVTTYFEIGRKIVEEEQGGKERAGYGRKVIKELSKVLTVEFGKGFSERNIEQMRQFYLVYSKPQTLFAESENANQQTMTVDFKLSWSHYLKLMRIDDESERKFYEIEAAKNNWSVRELERQCDSALYTRLILSRDKDKVKELSEKGLLLEKPKDAVKDPYILEFLGLPEHSTYSESQLEQELIDKLEHFLLELGNGFTFVARQKRISFDGKHFWIDLVFYNRFLKCFVLIDLKIGELTHQDLGQMQMYVNYYDREVRIEDENKAIGIVLCKDKSESIVEYTMPEDNEHIFASKYKTVLPSKDELKLLINEKKSHR
jgi:predicted nuclease of restriction endonuclease-like (RecB) superfamily